jgi:hypothetical protein
MIITLFLKIIKYELIFYLTMLFQENPKTLEWVKVKVLLNVGLLD